MLMNRKKGMTLAEIVVVLAVVAIVSTIVVSFALMVNSKSLISRNRAEVIGEITLVEKIIDDWIYKQSILENNELNVDTNSIIGRDSVLSFADNKILDYEFENIKSITFEKVKRNTADKDIIIFCTVNYYLINGAGEKEEGNLYVFCVNEYVGDII